MILVTGGTGFVGRNLIEELLKGRGVRCLVRHPERGFPLSGVELVRGDVTDKRSVLGAMGGVDAVVHLVGILMESKGSAFRAVHVEGTRNVVEACGESGVARYIHVSALGTRPFARSEYHRTKWEAEEAVRASSLDYTIFRPSVIFGKEDKFTNLFARAMRLSPVIMIPGDGRNKMQPVFVKDLARAMSDSIDMAAAGKATFEAAGPEIYTFDEIIDSIAAVLNKSPFKLHVPMSLMRLNAALLETVLPRPPITRDALLMLEEDNVTADNALINVFGIKPTGFMEGMRTYLH
ncbi:MAG: complex I NDUFA9 subunit family protein [Deltaproteobacteria bacterium]|nr:complex I NDUFA9 subunit family protein [Deltaproteobacteria bacterium]